jgi:hypothetical protein
MIGTPVEVIEQEDEKNCRHALATDVQFYRGQETGAMSGGRVPMKMQKALCATLRR